MNCRHCKKLLSYTFVDLGFAPPSNAYLSEDDLTRPEIYYPLKIKVCDQCWLVQTEDYADADSLFTPDYAYFSSTSSSFLLHAKDCHNSIVEKIISPHDIDIHNILKDVEKNLLHSEENINKACLLYIRDNVAQKYK